MRPTKRTATVNNIAVDIRQLQEMLSCGRTAAERIARDSGAGFNIGRRRLYSVQRIRDYMETLCGDPRQKAFDNLAEEVKQ